MDPASSQNPTGSPALQLWLAYPGDLAEPAAEAACAAILSDAERVRAARFRFDRHRHEFLATHALTRVALSHNHPLPPRAWSFSTNSYGKPTPNPECGLRFNQSNSVELAVCLIALRDAKAVTAEVGVDVESMARAEGIVPLAGRVFSAAERAQLDALPAAERPDRALSLWTLKEAYIKARGMGLSLPLQEISFLFGEPGTNRPEAIRFEVAPAVDSDPGRWRFCRFDHAGHRITLAVEVNAAGPLAVYEVRPPMGSPARLAWSAPAWF